mmetsp:Transcript_88576/g.275568  ORF Transcript_88576/g.275568 Transcript_88576/m.275568 type:complete len:289 (-) Transcript_88576:34-900(-)
MPWGCWPCGTRRAQLCTACVLGVVAVLHAWLSKMHQDRLRAEKVLKLIGPRCGSRGRLQRVLKKRNTTALIIGAHVGKVYTDPVFDLLGKPAAAHVDKVFVEPMPSLFRELQRNIAGMPRALAVQAAVAQEAGNTTLYCLGLENTTENLTFMPAAQRITGTIWWSQICSLSRERLFHPHDVGRRRYSVDLRDMVTENVVPAITVEQLLRDHTTSPVRYVQIDVEGMDDVVVRQLPLEAPGFRPALIVFEFMLLGEERLEAAVRHLQRHGYSVCHEGMFQNLEASPSSG